MEADSAAVCLEAYRPLALAIAREYYFPGADEEDVRQEAMIALTEALRTYRPERGTFAPFARAVLHRRLTSALKASRRKKHLVLTEAVRTEVERKTDREWALDPALIYEAREDALELLRRVKEDLSPLERQVLIAAANGRSHADIAQEVGGTQGFNSEGRKRYPRVYNTLDRARRKLAA